MSPSRRGDRAPRTARFAALACTAGVVTALVTFAEYLAHRALRRRNNQHLHLAAFLEQTPTPLYVKRLDGRYETVSAAFECQYGLKPGTAVGRLDREVHTPEQLKMIRAREASALATEGAVAFKDELAGGEDERTLVTTVHILRDSRQRPYATVGVGSDVTHLLLVDNKFRVPRLHTWPNPADLRLAPDLATLRTEIEKRIDQLRPPGAPMIPPALSRLLAATIGRLPEHMRRIDRAFSIADADSLRHEAQQVKGVLANLGVKSASELFERLDALALERDLPAAADVWGEARPTLDLVCEAVRLIDQDDGVVTIESRT